MSVILTVSLIGVCSFFGSFATHELLLFRDLALSVKSAVYLDVGGNTGHHSLFMSQYCDQVHYFEPLPTLIARLEENIKINEISNINIHRYGISDQDNTLEYFPSTTRNLGTGSFLETHSNTHGEPILLPVKSGDKVMSSLNLKSVDIVKIDVEGFEVDVLRGFRSTFEDYQPFLVLEVTRSTFSRLDPREKLDSLISFPSRVYEVKYAGGKFLFLEGQGYMLQRVSLDSVTARDNSLYLLIVPESKLHLLSHLQTPAGGW